jgi:hypothetical protein
VALEYRYAVYNPGQYGPDVQAQLDAMVAAGWQVHTAMPNYSELYVLWQRELPRDAAAGRRRLARPAEAPPSAGYQPAEGQPAEGQPAGDAPGGA